MQQATAKQFRSSQPLVFCLIVFAAFISQNEFERVVWHFFSGLKCDEPRLPCDATWIGRFRRLLGEEGNEQLHNATIDCAVDVKAIKPADLDRVIVYSTGQFKVIAHPVDNRLLESARHAVFIARAQPDVVEDEALAGAKRPPLKGSLPPAPPASARR